MPQVHIVTKGQYSDYQIMAAFTDEALATDFAAQFFDTQVETFDLMSEPPTMAVHYMGYASLNADGTLRSGPHLLTNDVWITPRNTETYASRSWGNDHTLWAHSLDPEWAKRSITDRAAQIAAKRKGLT